MKAIGYAAIGYAMHWTPEGKRKRGRPKITWRLTVEKEIKEMGKTWEGIKFMAKDRQMWREHVQGSRLMVANQPQTSKNSVLASGFCALLAI